MSSQPYFVIGQTVVDVRTVAADAALLATAAATVALFAISPITLEHFGVSYITSGGGVLSKFHPATLLAVLALGLRCLATPRPVRTALFLFSDPGATLIITAALLTGVYAVVVAKTPVTPLIDTFVLPAAFFLLLRDLDGRLLNWLTLIVIAILITNSVMAMIEFLRGVHFVSLDFAPNASADPTRGDVVFDWRVDIVNDWRAIALFGHPLVNGLIVGCAILCLAAPGSRWIPAAVRAPLTLLLGVSMFAFGARASLVLVGVMSAGLLLQKAGEAVRDGDRIGPRTIAFALLVIAIGIGLVAVLNETGFFDRTIDRFNSDAGSAATRSTMLELFTPFSWSDLLLGPDKDVVATWQRVYGLEFGIESAWVGLILAYGILVTMILVVGLVALSRSIVLASGRGATLVLLFYFLSVSATASLSGKTTSLAMMVVLILLFLRKNEDARPWRRALGLTIE